MKTADLILNLVIAFVTPFFLIRFHLREGRKEPGKTREAMRFYTCQSNLLCSVAALLYALASLAGPAPDWAWIVKYIGTAAVTVTMLTVFLFLAPSIGKDWVKYLLTGSDIFMHLLTPLLALFTFCVFERQGMTFCESLWGLLPVLLYGPLYLYKILFAPPEKRWDDFYGFNKQGKWPVAFAAMVAGTFAICMGIRALQNL